MLQKLEADIAHVQHPLLQITIAGSRWNWAQKCSPVATTASAQLRPLSSPPSRCWRSEASVARERCASRIALAVPSLSSRRNSIFFTSRVRQSLIQQPPVPVQLRPAAGSAPESRRSRDLRWVSLPPGAAGADRLGVKQNVGLRRERDCRNRLNVHGLSAVGSGASQCGNSSLNECRQRSQTPAVHLRR